MYNPYQQYESGNQQYYPPVPQSYTPQATPQATPSFNCDMNAYGYTPTNAAPFNNQYCEPYYPPEAYNGCPNPMQPNPMQPYAAPGPDMFAASSAYYNYNLYVPTDGNGYGYNGAQPPTICNQNPVQGVPTPYPEARPSDSNYSAVQPPIFNQNPVPGVPTPYPEARRSDSNYSAAQPPIFNQNPVPGILAPYPDARPGGPQPPTFNQNPVSGVLPSYPEARPQPPIFNQNPVPNVLTPYPDARAAQPPIFNQTPVPSVPSSYPNAGPAGSQPSAFNRSAVTNVSTSFPRDSSRSKSVAVVKPYAVSSSHQSSAKSNKRLPSPDSFIKECLSGRKSGERRKKEEMIESSMQKTLSMESKSRRNDESSQRDYGFVAAKKPDFKSWQRSPGSKDLLQSRKKWDFIKRWRLNYCKNEKEWRKKMEKLVHMNPQELITQEKQKSTRTTPAESFYVSKSNNRDVLEATEKCVALSEAFKVLAERAERTKAARPPYEPERRKINIDLLDSEYDDDSDEMSQQSDDEEHENEALAELKRKQHHPYRLHQELWYNEKGELNDGPHCRCSRKARKSGIRHNIYNGENVIPKCDPYSNNADKLYHYRITISPPTNFLINTPTIIKYDDHEFIFEGFSLFSHYPLERLPACRIIRFNWSYTILYIDEKMPDNFTIAELDLFYKYFFQEILELVDFDLFSSNVPEGESTCPIFHFMPRFVRELPEDNGCEILSMCHVLKYLIDSSEPLIEDNYLEDIQKIPSEDWQDMVKDLKGSIVTKPGMKPCSIRVDQLDRDTSSHPSSLYPDIIHFGIRPPQLSYAGSKKYQRLWRVYVKFKHLLANMPKPSMEDKLKLHNKEIELQKMRTESKFQRGVTVVLSSEGFYKTGIMCDVVQHALLIPVLVCHLRFHRSLNSLEEKIQYKFKNRFLLQLALTHPSYRENFGTNPDHVRNILTNCGIRQPEYGDRRIHYWNTRKRGINTLISIMSKFGNSCEKQSSIMHNERLEFLGDAVIEFITSIHLYHLFPEIEEGGLATYRAAIVQNQHLTLMALELELHQYMLFAHGSDLCHDLELRHAMANCFEALLGALYLDGGLKVADRVFSETFFSKKPHLLDLWTNYPTHPLQQQEPSGDRAWISTFPVLQKLTEFEDKIGVTFKHIRLLARAFTDRSIGFTNLTLGSNQRMEFLGDTILQLICSLYLYKYFPDHHEGHLSLLRSSLVNNKTQAVVCDDLGMQSYAVYANPKELLKVKDRADLLEAFLGALYIDRGMKYCEEFCNVCFFPRLRYFIMRQDWNDPKSKLQQCCLTLRSIEGREPDIPIYKVIECKGPTNGRTYTVAVYFKGKRLAVGHGHNIQQAEMNSATKALESYKDLFPHLEFQKRAIYKSIQATQKETSTDSKHSSKHSRHSSQSRSSKSSKPSRPRSPSGVKSSKPHRHRSRSTDSKSPISSRPRSPSSGSKSQKPDRHRSQSTDSQSSRLSCQRSPPSGPKSSKPDRHKSRSNDSKSLRPSRQRCPLSVSKSSKPNRHRSRSSDSKSPKSSRPRSPSSGSKSWKPDCHRSRSDDSKSSRPNRQRSPLNGSKSSKPNRHRSRSTDSKSLKPSRSRSSSSGSKSPTPNRHRSRPSDSKSLRPSYQRSPSSRFKSERNRHRSWSNDSKRSKLSHPRSPSSGSENSKPNRHRSRSSDFKSSKPSCHRSPVRCSKSKPNHRRSRSSDSINSKRSRHRSRSGDSKCLKPSRHKTPSSGSKSSRPNRHRSPSSDSKGSKPSRHRSSSSDSKSSKPCYRCPSRGSKRSKPSRRRSPSSGSTNSK